MKKINNQFLIYKTVQGFKDELAKGEIQKDSIVFVIEDRSIHTHDLEFGNRTKDRGFFVSSEKLPAGSAGDHAVVKEGDKWYLYIFDKNDGWVKTIEYGMPDITKETLDQYIKKENIQAYLRDIYNDTYVRRDEVYTPDQEDWDHQAIDEHDEWQWDEDGNLYRIDAEFSTTSRNSLQNRVITNEFLNRKEPMSYDYYSDFLYDLERGLIPNDIVVYIKDKGIIYAFGTYFSGGGGVDGVPVQIDPPIMYQTPTNKADFSPTYSVYTAVPELNSSKLLTILLDNKYLLLLIPTEYSVSNILTSNNETLTLEDDFILDPYCTEIYDTDNDRTIYVNAYKYFPAIAPNMSLTFTFNIPQ